MHRFTAHKDFRPRGGIFPRLEKSTKEPRVDMFPLGRFETPARSISRLTTWPLEVILPTRVFILNLCGYDVRSLHLRSRGADMKRCSASETNALAKCPNCRTHTRFFKFSLPHIDSCGFESYSLRCDRCGGVLGGTIDPLSDRLFLSLLDPSI
jgi:hypothetical protein